ncbi:MAG: biotin/lipoyl-containing protein [Eubacteriales bacterium]
MKKYNVTVNGVTYEVEVEEVAADSVSTAPAVNAAPAAPKAEAPKPAAPKAAPKAAPAAPAKAGSVVVKAPMPGNIIKINVKSGDAVKKGDVLCILEAMKMENEICAPSDGVVASVAVAQGASVQTDDVLVSLN